MKNFALIISLILFINTNAQIDNIAEKLGFEKDAKLLIIHGDDIGVSHSVNIASFDGYKNNAINSGSAMIPSPWIKEVAEFHRENPKYDIGLHLTLTAEWKNYKWNGVSSSNQISSLLNEDYEFYDNTSDVNINANPEEVRRELQAQIDFSRQIGLNPTHIDTHMGALAVNKKLWRVYIEVGHKNKLVSMVTKSRALNLFDDDFPMPNYIVPVNDIYMLYPGADRTFLESAFGEDLANTAIVEDIYKYEDKLIVDDYAHHPTEIKSIFNTIDSNNKDKPKAVIFQPHLFTRTRDLMDDFAKALSYFQEVYLLDIYPAREKPINGVTSEALLNKIDVSKKEIIKKVQINDVINYTNCKIIAILGAGDLTENLNKKIFTNE